MYFFVYFSGCSNKRYHLRATPKGRVGIIHEEGNWTVEEHVETARTRGTESRENDHWEQHENTEHREGTGWDQGRSDG